MNTYTNQQLRDWAAILDDDEYTWPQGELVGRLADDVMAYAMGYYDGKAEAEAKIEADRGMVIAGYVVVALMSALMGAVGMRLLTWLWGG